MNSIATPSHTVLGESRLPGHWARPLAPLLRRAAARLRQTAHRLERTRPGADEQHYIQSLLARQGKLD